MPRTPAPVIFHFEDYHAYVRAWFTARRAEGKFTLDTFAALLGEAHRSFPHGVMATGKDQKKLKPLRALSWARALGLGQEETAYLVALVAAEGAAQELSLRQKRVEEQAEGPPRARAIAHWETAAEAHRGILDELEGWRRLGEPAGGLEAPQGFAAAVRALRAADPPRPRLLVRGGAPPMPPGWAAEAHTALGDALARLGHEGAAFRPLCRFYRLLQAAEPELLPKIEQAFRQLAARLSGRFRAREAERVILLRLHVFPLTAPLEARSGGLREPPRSGWDVYDHEDHREALRTWLAAHDVSMRGYAELAGLRDPTLPRKVLAGEETLTPALALDFVRGMGLSRDEDAYFVLLVAAARGDDEERRQATDRARAARTVALAQRMRRDLMRLCRDWEQLVLFELVQVGLFVQDLDGLGERFRPPLSSAHLREALDALVRLGIVGIEEDGRCRGNASTFLAVTSGARGQEVNAERHAGHQRLHARAEDDVATPGEGSCLVDLLLPLEDAQWPGVRDVLDAFAQDLLGLCQGTVRAPNQVWHVGMEAIPCDGGGA